MPREPIDRREFIGQAGIGAGALILGGIAVDPALAAKRRTRRRGPQLAREGAFPQGVAAGTPGERGISLWTRMEGQSGDYKLRVEIARDPKFRKVVRRTTKTVRARKDHCLETRMAGKFLKPGAGVLVPVRDPRPAPARSGASRPRPPPTRARR